ncbi:MAG: hypothetical protein JSW53_02405 [Candidatus Bathyarchaeota archaeon]|nr:MAG: hypothetical protein JSW53_02405 [Candidatus Bathyarchaeota archaeon]
MRLPPGENVVWATQRGSFTTSLMLGIFGIAGGLILALFGFTGVDLNGVPLTPFPPLGWVGVVLVLVGLASIIISVVLAKSTKYILTDRRIVETRLGRVVKQIALSDFMGRPLSQFVDKHAAGTVNGLPVYNIRITDPKSADFMELTSLNQRAVEELERIFDRARQVVLCTYCSTKNSANSSTCSNCSAPLK